MAVKTPLAQLRKATGLPLLNCRQALDSHDGDLDRAQKWLLEEAQRQGWQRAEKVAHRQLKSGLVGFLSNPGITAFVELNCETDFVVKTELFQRLLSKITQQLYVEKKYKSNQIQQRHYSSKDLGELPLDESTTVHDLIAKEIGNIGENIAVSRGGIIRYPINKLIKNAVYVHSSLPNSVIDGVAMGKFGSLVIYKLVRASSTNQSSQFGQKLAQHVVGACPTIIGNRYEFNKYVKELNQVEKGPDEDEIVAENPNPDQHPDDVIVKEAALIKEENRLLFQKYIFDTDYLFGEHLDEHGVRIIDFIRLECGQEIN